MISIIIPVYNAESTLQKCLDSVLEQRFKDFEVLAVNDGSTDRSYEILKEYERRDSRVVIVTKPNGGVSSARNAALDVARGEWITFCDSDDYVELGWLDNFMSANTSVDLVLQGIIYELKNDKSSPHLLPDTGGQTLESKRELIASLISKGVFGYLFTKLFRRSIIEDNKIRFNTSSHFREDEEFFSTYLLYVNAWQSSDKAAYHYIMPDCNKKYKGDSYKSLVPIFKNLDKIFDKCYPSAIADIHAENIKGMIIQECCNGQIPTAYECDLYRRLRQSKSTTRNNPLVDALINNSHKTTFSRQALTAIHTLTKLARRNKCM